MKVTRVFQLFLVQAFVFQQIENVLLTKSIFFNILLPSNESKLTDFINVILNDQLVQALNRQENVTDVQLLYNEAIGKLYDHIPARDMIQEFWKIYKPYDYHSYVTATRGQLALYWRYKLDNKPDGFYVLLAAQGFFKIKNDEFFVRLPDSAQLLVESHIKNLPPSLQYFLGEKEFCLRNNAARYPKFLFQTSRGNLLSSSNSKSIVFPIFEETLHSNFLDLNFALVSYPEKGYFHRLAPDSNGHSLITANTTQTELKNFLWTLVLVNDNELVFKQDDYLLCDRTDLIYGLKEKTIYQPECQWLAEEC